MLIIVPDLIIGGGIGHAISGAIATWLKFYLPLWSVLYLFYMFVIIPISAGKRSQPPGSRQIAHAFVIGIDDIEAKCEVGNLKMPWHDFQSYRLLCGHLLIFMSPIQYLVMPKRCFTTEELDFTVERLKTAAVRHRGWL